MSSHPVPVSDPVEFYLERLVLKDGGPQGAYLIVPRRSPIWKMAPGWPRKTTDVRVGVTAVLDDAEMVCVRIGDWDDYLKYSLFQMSDRGSAWQVYLGKKWWPWRSTFTKGIRCEAAIHVEKGMDTRASILMPANLFDQRSTQWKSWTILNKQRTWAGLKTGMEPPST